MRYLILSDLHANLEATRAVLSDAASRGYDHVLCLGDIVGYGGNPNEVVDLVRSAAPRAIVRGNHDKVAAGIEDGQHFSEVAFDAAMWTRGALTPGNRDWLGGLPCGPAAIDGFLIAHGTPADEDAYILSDLDALLAFGAREFEIAFFGHSHFACAFELRGGAPILSMLEGDAPALLLARGSRYLVNPGSIGQPRDHDPRSAYAIYDADRREVTVRRVAYDVAAAQRRILDLGLPAPLAYRLEFGV